MVNEADQGLAFARLLELADGLGFDLPDSLPRDREDLPHLLQSVSVAVHQAVAKTENFALAVAELVEHVADAVLERLLVDVVERIVFAMVLDEFAEKAVVVIAHRLIERKRLTSNLHDAASIFDRDAGGAGGFLDVRLAACLLDQLASDGTDLAHRVDHVDRQADGAALVGDGPRDGLAN